MRRRLRKRALMEVFLLFPVECETFVRNRGHIDRSFSLVSDKPDLCRLSLASAVLCNPFDGKKKGKSIPLLRRT